MHGSRTSETPRKRRREPTGLEPTDARGCGRALMLRSAPLAPDVVYANATVLTMDEAHPRAEALATQGERIVAIGSSAEVRALAGPGTRVLDMPGRVVMPGFSEPHNHFGVYAL